MEPQLTGRRKNMARQLYHRTHLLKQFSVNNLRELTLDRFFTDPREHGGFFTDLMVDGYTIQVGETVATHKEARGRMVKTWKWTHHARKHLRSPM